VVVVSAWPADLAGERFGALVRDVRFVKRWLLLPRVASTNDELRRLAAAGAEEGTVVLADEQTAGRGRQGRSWHSTAGAGLYLSVLLRPSDPAPAVTRWTIAAALAAAEACRATSGVDVAIEWPNDLMAGGRKVGGILAESRTTGSRVDELILGVGINVHHAAADFPPELRTSATSLSIAGDRRPDRGRLAAALLERIGALAEDLARGGWPEIVAGWERLAPGARGSRVRVLPAGRDERAVEGVTCGLDACGALRVLGGDGRMIVVRRLDSVAALGR